MAAEIKKDILWRVGVIYFGFLLGGIAIIGRIVYLQLAEGNIWREKAEKLAWKNMIITPQRGDILSEDGRIISTSLPYYEIRVDMASSAINDVMFHKSIDSLSYCLSRLFRDRSKESYKAELVSARRNKERFHLLKRRVNYDELHQLKTFPLFRLGQYKGGLIVLQDNIRFMPHGDLAARTVGYITKSDEGNIVGIEGAYDEYLRGKEGVRLMQRIPGGLWMPISGGDQVEPEDGVDVVTTIDINLQDLAEAALRRQLELHKAHHGTVVVMEVSTGEIRAMVNLGLDELGRYREVYNYAIGESSEPGSTFKLPALMAAFEDHLVELTDTVNTGRGKFRIYDKEIRDAHDEGYGLITVKQVFEYSSNVGMAKLITRLYKNREKDFVDRLYHFHLNEPLGIELKGEGRPEIRYPGTKYWSGISLAMMAHGYEVRLTPLQILTFYNAVANGGRMMRPMFVKELRQRGKTIKRFSPQVIDPSICSRSTLKKARAMLEGVVDSGTAMNLRNASCKIAGKTGTAQIANQKFGYGKQYLASFVGYFPAEDPKYSCIVWVSSPSNSVYYGNIVAGPVFREIAQKIYATRIAVDNEVKKIGWFDKVEPPYTKGGYWPELEKVLDELDIPVEKGNDASSHWVITQKQDDKVLCFGKLYNRNLMPDVKGLGLKDALYILENYGLEVTVTGKGTVVNQWPQPGVRIQKGETVQLEMSQ